MVVEGFIKGRPLTDEELMIQVCDKEHGVLSNATESTTLSTLTSVTAMARTTLTDAIESTTTTLVDLHGNNDIIGEQHTQKPKDYTIFLAAFTSYIALFNLLMIIFFNAPFKRQMANKGEPNPDTTPS